MNDITKIKVDGELESTYKLFSKNREFEKRAGGAGGTDISLGLTSTAVGQIIKVKAIDDGGKPTAWEAVDMPSGGGVSDYTELSNKPKINGVELSGDKTSADYGIGNPTDEQVASSVEAWLDAHPEATTTVADGSINPDKTTWMRQVWHNIFDVSTITDGRYFYSSSNDDTTGGGTADYFVSDYIPVVAGREYVFSHKNMTLRWTDANKTFISGSASTVSAAGQKVTAPDGAAFVRFSLIKSGLTPEEVQAQVYEYMGGGMGIRHLQEPVLYCGDGCWV